MSIAHYGQDMSLSHSVSFPLHATVIRIHTTIARQPKAAHIVRRRYVAGDEAYSGMIIDNRRRSFTINFGIY